MHEVNTPSPQKVHQDSIGRLGEGHVTPKKYQPDEKQKIYNKISLLNSESDADWTSAINCLSQNPEYVDSSMIPRIFQIGSTDDPEMQYLVLTFLLTYLKSPAAEPEILVENNVINYLSNFVSEEDPFLFTHSLEIIQILCEYNTQISQLIANSDLIQKCYGSSQSSIETMETMGNDDTDDDFTNYCYIVEGTLKIFTHYLPSLQTEMMTLLIMLVSSKHRILQIMSLDFLFYLAKKCDIDLLVSFVEIPQFSQVLQNVLASKSTEAALYVALTFVSRDTSFIPFFINAGILNIVNKKLSRDELVLFFHFMNKLAECQSNDYDEYLGSLEVANLANEHVIDQPFEVSKPVVLFMCALASRNEPELLNVIVEHYRNVYTLAIRLVSDVELNYQQYLLRFIVIFLTHIVNQEKTIVETIMNMLNPNEIIEACEGVLSNMEISPEMEEACHQIIETLEQYEQ